jgi:hypothetical protein
MSPLLVLLLLLGLFLLVTTIQLNPFDSELQYLFLRTLFVAFRNQVLHLILDLLAVFVSVRHQERCGREDALTRNKSLIITVNADIMRKEISSWQ